MDAIQTDAKVLADLNKQRTSYETKLRDELSNRQKELENEKVEIEKSQDVPASFAKTLSSIKRKNV